MPPLTLTREHRAPDAHDDHVHHLGVGGVGLLGRGDPVGDAIVAEVVRRDRADRHRLSAARRRRPRDTAPSSGRGTAPAAPARPRASRRSPRSRSPWWCCVGIRPTRPARTASWSAARKKSQAFTDARRPRQVQDLRRVRRDLLEPGEVGGDELERSEIRRSAAVNAGAVVVVVSRPFEPAAAAARGEEEQARDRERKETSHRPILTAPRPGWGRNEARRYDRPMADDTTRRTDSGIEVKPQYTAADLEAAEFDPIDGARRRRHPALHPGRLRPDVPDPAVDDAPVLRLRHRRRDQRALPLPPRRRPDRPLVRLRPAHPDGLRLRPPAGRGRGRQGRRGDRLARGHGDPARRASRSTPSPRR